LVPRMSVLGVRHLDDLSMVQLQISAWGIRHLLEFRNRYRASEDGGHDRSYRQDYHRPDKIPATAGSGIIVDL
jgi:hypothetical protein